MKIERTDLKDLETTLSITIEKNDYHPKFIEEMKKHRGKSHLKGFRKGRTPMSAIKKMYGKGVIAEVINGVLEKSLTDYIQNEKLNVLGSPLPNRNQEAIDFDVSDFKDYTFVFDLGLAPEFDIIGVSETDEYIKYNVVIPEALLLEELDLRRRKLGESIEVEDKIEEEDILTIKAVELENGEVKDKGWETGFTILTNRIDNPEIYAQVLKSKVGESFDFDIYTIEKDAKEEYVKKYLLNLDEGEEKEIGKDFRGTIEKISHREPAKLEKDFFDKAFGEDAVNTKEEAMLKIEEELMSYYENQEKAFTYRNIMDALIDKNELELPKEFLKRWLESTNENTDPEEIEKGFGDFEKNLKWTLLKGKLTDQFEVNVDIEEIKEHVKGKIRQYMGNNQVEDQMIEGMVMNFLKEREQVEKEYEEIRVDKIFKKVCEHVKLTDKKIDVDEFKEMVKEMNERIGNK